MAVKSIRSVVESHQRLNATFAKQLKELAGKRPPTAELPTREIEREAARIRGRLDTVSAARDRAVKRFDQEIEQLSAALATLEQRLAADAKNLEQARGAGPKRPGGGASPAISIEEIGGIGASRRRKLEKAGIADVSALAAAKPAVVSQILAVPRDQAKAFIREAKKLTKG